MLHGWRVCFNEAMGLMKLLRSCFSSHELLFLVARTVCIRNHKIKSIFGFYDMYSNFSSFL